MKYRIYAIIQLIILVFYLARPALPYIDYAVNKDFIIKKICVKRGVPNNCCKGKCYLKKQISKSNEADDTKEKGSNKKNDNKEIKEYISSGSLLPIRFETTLCTQHSKETFSAQKFVSSIFTPPKQA